MSIEDYIVEDVSIEDFVDDDEVKIEDFVDDDDDDEASDSMADVGRQQQADALVPSDLAPATSIEKSFAAFEAMSVNTTGDSEVLRVVDALIQELDSSSSAVPLAVPSMQSPLAHTTLNVLLSKAVGYTRANDPLGTARQKLHTHTRIVHRRHVQAMLRTPTPGEPVCSRGTECIGTRVHGGGMSTILRAFCFAGDEKPMSLCILCLRYEAMRLYIGSRVARRQPFLDADGQASFGITLGFVMNAPGEYAAAFYKVPRSACEPFAVPFVPVYLEYLEATYDEARGVVVVLETVPYPQTTHTAFDPDFSEAS